MLAKAQYEQRLQGYEQRVVGLKPTRGGGIPGDRERYKARGGAQCTNEHHLICIFLWAINIYINLRKIGMDSSNWVQDLSETRGMAGSLVKGESVRVRIDRKSVV